MSFSQKVRDLMEKNGMTKAKLAKAAGIPYTTLDSMLKRETDSARLECIFRIASALSTSVEELVFDDLGRAELGSEEKRILELYSLLDSRGKDTVLSLLEREADHSHRKTIPLYTAPAAAGTPAPLFSEEYTLLPYEEGEIPRGTDFAVRLSGESMTPMFSHGDIVYVSRAKELKNGEIGIFLLNGEGLCKQYQHRNGKTFLVSYNPDYAPILVLETDELSLVGKVLR